MRGIVHAFKFRGRRSLASPLARLMLGQAEGLLAGVDWIVPVPLHRRRVRVRGFNQAEDLARALARASRQRAAGSRAVGPRGRVLCALRRVADTAPQRDLPAARRHRNVAGAFALARRVGLKEAWRGLARAVFPGRGDGASAEARRDTPARHTGRTRRGWRHGLDTAALLEGRCVLLVDDVCTTGATLNACARVLKQAGVREVRALTAARAVRTPRAGSRAPPLLASPHR